MFLLRVAERTFLGLLFQLPPRTTRRARRAARAARAAAPPARVIALDAILMAPVDLLWFGGIVRMGEALNEFGLTTAFASTASAARGKTTTRWQSAACPISAPR